MDSSKSQVFISSKNQVDKSEFTITFDIAYPKVIDVYIESISMPTSWYNLIPSKSWVDFMVGVVNYSVQLSTGTYDLTSLLSEMLSKMNAAFAGFTATFNTITGKVTIANATPFALMWQTGAHNTANIEKLIGFNHTDTAFALSQVGNNVPNTSKINTIYLESSSLGPKITNKCTFNGQLSNLIAAIPLQVGNYEIDNSYKGPGHLFCTTHDMTNLSLKLVDEDGVKVDNNGVDWSMILILTTAVA